METRILLILAQPRDGPSQTSILRRAVTVLSTLEQQDTSLGLFCNGERSATAQLQFDKPSNDLRFQIIYETYSELVAICGEQNTILTILVNPCLRTLRRTLYENLVSMNDEIMFKCHVLYAGYTHQGSDWMLDDCTLSTENLHKLVEQVKRKIVSQSRVKPTSFGTSPFRMKRAQLSRTCEASVNVKYTAVREQRKNTAQIGKCRLAKLLTNLLARSHDNSIRTSRPLQGPKACFDKPTALLCAAGDGDGFLFAAGGYCVAVNGGFCQRSGFSQVLAHSRVDSLFVTHLGLDTLGGAKALLRDLASCRVQCKQLFVNWPATATATATATASGRAPSSPSKTARMQHARKQCMNVDELLEFQHVLTQLQASSLRVRPYLAEAGNSVKFTVLFRKPGCGALLACALNPRPEATEWTKFVHLASGQRNARQMRLGLHDFPLADLVCLALLLVYVSESQTVTSTLYPGNLPTRSLLKALDRVGRVDLTELASTVLSRTGELHEPDTLSPLSASPRRLCPSPVRQAAPAAPVLEPVDSEPSDLDFLFYRTTMSVGGLVTVLTPIAESGEDREQLELGVGATDFVQLVTQPSVCHSDALAHEIIDVSSSNESEIDDDSDVQSIGL